MSEKCKVKCDCHDDDDYESAVLQLKQRVKVLEEALGAKEKVLTELEGFYSALRNDRDFLRRRVEKLGSAAQKAFKELNEIRARDGVPYTSDGWKAGVDEKYFSSVVDELSAALAPPVGEKEK